MKFCTVRSRWANPFFSFKENISSSIFCLLFLISLGKLNLMMIGSIPLACLQSMAN